MSISSHFSLRETDFFRQSKEVIKSLGVVFGDIGTSPQYTLAAIFFEFCS